MPNRSGRFGTLLALAIAPLALSCADDATSPVLNAGTSAQAEVRLIVDPGQVVLQVGEAVQFRAAMTDCDGTPLNWDDQRIIAWTSSRPEVAEVDESGVLQAFAAGSTIVTAGCAEQCAYASVTVVTPIDVDAPTGQ